MLDSLVQNAALMLFVWVLANQAGVPVPAVPSLVAAGALASGGSLKVCLLLAVIMGAALSADLVWYGLGRWRGPQALAVIVRLFRRPAMTVDRVEQVFLSHPLRFLWSARFLPELNPVGAGMAGATRVQPFRFLLYSAGSALLWAGTWVGAGYVLAEAFVTH
jgi:membrane protein DedA with SNARE-associated domain